eukprot:5730071-Heterocapsa_arctica.AAC.1
MKEEYDVASYAQTPADATSSTSLDWNFGFMGLDVDTDRGVDIPGGSRQSVWSCATMHAFQP